MAIGDILAMRIASVAKHNGWVAEIDIDLLTTGGVYDMGLIQPADDPSTAKIVLTVTSPGFDQAGIAITRTRYVYATKWMRQATPNDTIADESVAGNTLTVRCPLSDPITSSDTVTATVAAGFYTKTGTPNNARSSFAVTNNSTLTYPKPVARWAWPSFETFTDDFPLEVCAFHHFGGSTYGPVPCPVAAIKFTVSDGTTTYTTFETKMVVSPRGGDQYAVLVFRPTIPLAQFTQGANLTCDFVVYPWIGDVTLSSSTGFTDERLGSQIHVCDKGSTYGQAFCVIDPVNGQNSVLTTWISTTQALAESSYATAKTNSYTTIANAVQALKTYNNANFTRNEPGNGVILLSRGNHTWDTTSPADSGAMNTWCTITRLSSEDRANCVINNGLNAGLFQRRIKLYDISLTGAVLGQINGGDNTLDYIWVDQCYVNLTNANTGLYNFKLGYATRNKVDGLTGGWRSFSTTKTPWALVRGNRGKAMIPSVILAIGCQAYCVLGNYAHQPVFMLGGATGDNVATDQPSDNAIVAFNACYELDVPWFKTHINEGVTDGIAVVQNVVEKAVAASDVLVAFWADGETVDTKNVIIWFNTFAGERTNLGYNETGTVAHLHSFWSMIGNLMEAWNNKDDTFAPASANRTGAWPIGHNVGSRGNYRRTSNNNPEWLGEYAGLFRWDGGLLGFANDLSNDNGARGFPGTSGAGNGDYHLTALAGAVGIMRDSPLPYDLDGVARKPNNGSAGAYEYPLAADPSGWTGAFE